MAFRAPSPPPFQIPGTTLSIKRSDSERKANENADESEQAPRDESERVRADNALLQRLMWAGYAGPDWERLERNLAVYGLHVVTGWIRSGRMARKCREHRIFCPEIAPAARDTEASQDLAVDVVVRALRYFLEKVLIPGKWDPTKGASLRTYFVGACCLLFPNAYRTWSRAYSRNRVMARARHLEDDALNGIADLHPSADALGRLISRQSLRARLNEFDEKTQVTAVLDAQGHSNIEIAESLGASPKSIEGRLYRFRRKLDR